MFPVQQKRVGPTVSVSAVNGPVQQTACFVDLPIPVRVLLGGVGEGRGKGKGRWKVKAAVPLILCYVKRRANGHPLLTLHCRIAFGYSINHNGRNFVSKYQRSLAHSFHRICPWSSTGLSSVSLLLYAHRNRRLIRDGEPRTAPWTFTQLPSSSGHGCR